MNSPLLDLIGNTPLIELSAFDTGCCRLFVKLESRNPGGSIKDRIGLSMIEAAEQARLLKSGGTIIEATSGNTGIGLALVAALKGYKLILVIPEKMSQEKIFHLRAMGAEVVVTRSDVGKGHPEYYQDLAESIAKETPGAFYVNQFNNNANPLAHERTTGPEIWKQTIGTVGAVVCGVGSGGTITGLSRYFEKVCPEVDIVLADPVGSILVDYVKTGTFGEAGSWYVEGMGEDFIPPLCDLSRVKHAYSVSDRESFDIARKLLREEGILAGSSTGTLIAAALQYCHEQTTPKNVVTFVCDSGNKYLSKMFNDYWMMDHGFIKNKRYGDLRDFIGRPHDSGCTISTTPESTLNQAFSKMKLYDLSQLPVLSEKKIVGILHETDLLLALTQSEEAFTTPVSEHMSKELETLPPSAGVEKVVQLIRQGLVPVIAEGDTFYGLVTSFDVVNSLRLKLAEGQKG